MEIETAALRRCFAARLAARPRSAAAAADATADAPPLSPDVLQQCVAVACGWASCVVGAGVYAPQVTGATRRAILRNSARLSEC